MKPKIKYIKRIAKKYHDTSYYKSNEFNVKNLEFMEKEKDRLKTEKKENVTLKIKELLKNTKERKDNIFTILEKIYDKNQDYAFNKTKTKPLNSDLLNLVADPALLMVSYAKVRKNKGAMTPASEMSDGNYNKLKSEEKSWVNKTTTGPDGITKEIFTLTSKLIKENRYPWGASRRIYVDKPGKKDVKRPITIPPIMDRIVQESIVTLLMAIYEPHFEKLNCSFGFRPNKGVHDAILTLTNANAIGLNMALEGDIKSAYDKVNRKRLMQILSERIHDRKFLNFLKKRMDYEFYDSKDKKYIKDKEGLPQGGIDSPYMWNIYMLVFDEFIINKLTEETENNNVKARGKNRANSKKNIASKEKRAHERKITTLRKIIILIKNLIKKGEDIETLKKYSKFTRKTLISMNIMEGELQKLSDIWKEIEVKEKETLHDALKAAKKLERSLVTEGFNLASRDSNKIRLRFIYVRYADDWIILSNMKPYMMEKIKNIIHTFLKDNLSAELSMEKTLLTNVKETPAHFLGFEIHTYKNKKIGTYSKRINGEKRIIRAITAGSRVFTTPDRQRIIDRLYMKGYCDRNGFPREIGFLSNMEDFSIIDRFNSVLRGIAQYYAEWVKNPKRNLGRAIYIIRYSCIKTIAQKHKMSVRKVFKKYRVKTDISQDLKSREKTIGVQLKNIIGDKTYVKSYNLLTHQKLIRDALSLKRKKKLTDIYWTLNKGKPIIYKELGKCRITNDNFYDKISWINIRTQSSFDLPCSICGSEDDIEMHHIKHVRKNRYDLIDGDLTWFQTMSLRNRKQIPVCRECHINIIHKGKYGGTKLSVFTPKVMYDNRIITIESHLNREALNGIQMERYSKTLLDKGWSQTTP